MPNHETLTAHWLSDLLSQMGDTRDKVAETLRRSRISGRRGSPYDCPIARFVASRVRAHLPDDVTIFVAVSELVYVEIITPDHGIRTIRANRPAPVTAFIVAFDNADSRYDDLTTLAST